MSTNHSTTATITGDGALIGSLDFLKDGIKTSSSGSRTDYVSGQSSPSDASPVRFYFDLGSAKDISGVIIYFFTLDGTVAADGDAQKGYTAEDYKIQVSDVGGTNDADWTDAISITGNDKAKRVHSFTSVNKRYLRFRGTHVSAAYGYMGFVEVEIYDTLPDLISPTVSITTPSGTTNISGSSVNLQGTCSDNIEVVGLQPKLNGVNWGAEITGSGLTSFNVNRNSFDFPNGTYTLTVVARDPAGNLTTSSGKTVNIQNAPTAGFSIPSIGVVDVPIAITDESANATSYAYDKENDGSTDSTDDEPSFTYNIAGTYTIKQIVTNSYGSNNVTHSIVISDALPLNYGFDAKEVELFCEADYLELSDGNNVTSFTDQSIHARHLTAPSAYPTFQTNEINSLPVVRFSSSNPLKNTAAFTFQCGWILAKYDGATFPDTSDGYKGLLSDLVDKVILSGKRNTNEFKDFGFDLYEFRSNDRIYSVNDEGELHAPAPMSSFKLIFFRFWNPIEVDGIQLGQELSNTNRKWSGDVALLILTSRDYVEEEIRSRSEAMAEAYSLTLADVFPFQPDYDGTEEGCVQSINQYDAPEGERFAEAIDESRRLLNLKFSGADKDEIKEMKKFHKEHFASATLCLFRDYRFTPPQDIEGYINSAYKIDGKPNDWNYSFDFQEK